MKPILVSSFFFLACILRLPSVQPLTTIRSPPFQKVSSPLLHDDDVAIPSPLKGDWEGTKHALRNPNCCVVTVPGLEEHMHILQTHFADNGPSDLDLRIRVRVKSSLYEDCFAIRQSVTSAARMSIVKGGGDEEIIIKTDDGDDDDKDKGMLLDDPCTSALLELARGVALLADGPLEGKCDDVFIRVVCASNYNAHDPMYHTDKSPLRGYVTLRGVGTEFMTRTCSPLEYITLRGLGGGVSHHQSIRQAEELEFIVMKGDEYVNTTYEDPKSNFIQKSLDLFLSKLWKRRFACVHRSPPGAECSRRKRVIVSLDLADGDDDREWYQAGQRREWRSGMTQRKSRLVA